MWVSGAESTAPEKIENCFVNINEKLENFRAILDNFNANFAIY